MKRTPYRHGVTASVDETERFLLRLKTLLAPPGSGPPGGGPPGGGPPRGPRFDWSDAIGEGDHVYVATEDGAKVGFATINYPSPHVARLEESTTGLRLGRDWEDNSLSRERAAQLGTPVVEPDHRGGAVVGILIDSVCGRLEARNVTVPIALAPLATTDAAEATRLLLAAQLLGLVHRSIFLRARRPAAGGPPRHPLSPAEVEWVLRGGLDQFPVPLKQYFDLGALVCGEPVPLGEHGVFVVPVVCRTRPSEMVPPDLPGGGAWRRAA